MVPLGLDQRAGRLRPTPGDSQQELAAAPSELEGKRSGWARAQVVFGSCRGAGCRRSERQLVRREAVLSEQVLGLIESQLARRRGGLASLHRGSGDRLEGAEVGVVEQPLPFEPRDEAEHLAVLLTGGPDHELGGGAAEARAASLAAPRGRRRPASSSLGSRSPLRSFSFASIRTCVETAPPG